MPSTAIALPTLVDTSGAGGLDLSSIGDDDGDTEFYLVTGLVLGVGVLWWLAD
jgi:hypothetical protein